MPHLIEVAFKGNRKEFFLWEGDEPPPPRSAVIVDADRGEDLGRVHAIGELAARRCAGCSHGSGGGAEPTKRARRLATGDDLRREAEARAQDEEARRRATERVRANNLVMKLSDAEWQWDRKKLTLYFTAEKRVDFRNLVRELAAMFRTRIELKQIGVRDEAKRLDGVGRCGRQYCSASWLPELRPVNLAVAKDQRLSLNPSQISGACGRLMCCLRYEHDFYVQSRKRFPKEGKVLRTARGEEKVIANDIFNDRVTLRSVEGDTRLVALAELRRELERGAETSEPWRAATPASPEPTQAPEPVEEGEPITADAGDDGEGEPLADEPPAREARGGAPPEPEGRDGRETDERESPNGRPARRRGRRGGRRGRGGVGRGGAPPEGAAPPEGGPGRGA